MTILIGADDGAGSVTRPLSVRGDNLTNKLLLVGDDARSRAASPHGYCWPSEQHQGVWMPGGEEERVTSLVTS